jgi:hypothetical protein
VFTGAIASVEELTFIDPGNGLYGGTQLASATFFGAGATSSTNSFTPPLTGPYSETVEYIVTTNGAGSVNDTVDITDPTPVSEPSALLLAGLGIGGVFLLLETNIPVSRSLDPARFSRRL